MSNDLFDKEIQFHRLLKLVKSNATAGLKFFYLTGVLCDLLKHDGQNKFLSFYMELVPSYLKIILQHKISFLPPNVYDEALFVVNKLSEFEYFKSDSYTYNINEAIPILENGKRNIFTSTDSTLDDNSISVVLVEECKGNSFYDKEFGIIQKFNLSSSIRSGKEKIDNIEFKNILKTNQLDLVKCLSEIVDKAKEKCIRDGINISCYNYLFYFESNEFIYNGTSFGIAALCLAYNSILRNEYFKYYFKFKSDCAFSGEIDNKGKLATLDRNILNLKLRTVFFSGYKKFVIPADNFADAKEELALLNAEFPEKSLSVIPVETFEDVFKNLDIIERFELKLKDKIKL